MKTIKFLLIVLIAWFLQSCSEGYKKTESGLEYRFISENKDGTPAKRGDILVLRMLYKTESDSILFNTDELQGPFRMKLGAPSHSGGCIEDAFSLMKVGDSLECKIDAELFYMYTKKTELPDFIKPGEKLIFQIKLVKIFDYNEWEEERKNLHLASESEEMQLIKSYLQRTSTNVEPTESGLYYVEKEKGTGLKPEPGDLVSINYLVYFIDGSPIENSYETGKPFKFRLYTNEVIKGLDEGVSMMNAGGKAILIIPSKLAYGDKQHGNIPPYSTLVFEVELLSVEKLH
ncbi:MAG: hypothetical protein Kow0068_14040 [Marinilabiliales bacterium]